MTRALLVTLVWTLAVVPPLSAQPPGAPTAQSPAPQTTPPSAPPAAPSRGTASTSGGGGRPVNVTVAVTDGGGLGLQGVHVLVNGPVTRDGTTVADGSFRALGLKPGAYRLRFEHQRFVTLERDITVRGGQPTEVDVMLTRAPEQAKPEVPAPTPPPATERASAPLPAGSFDVTSYLEKDYLKSGPNRVKSIACSDTDAVDVVQTATSYAVPAGKRQLAVVAIAGQGRASVGGRSYPLDSRSGSTVTVPANTGFEASREGKSTLVFVLVSIGEGCHQAESAAR
jgi:hypothetical protein